MDHHGLPLDAPDVKGHRALHAVQVVVDAAGPGHEQGGGHPVQAQGAGQLVLEQAVEKADGLLGLVNRQQGGIPLWDAGDMIHTDSLLTFSILEYYTALSANCN